MKAVETSSMSAFKPASAKILTQSVLFCLLSLVSSKVLGKTQSQVPTNQDFQRMKFEQTIGFSDAMEAYRVAQYLGSDVTFAFVTGRKEQWLELNGQYQKKNGDWETAFDVFNNKLKNAVRNRELTKEEADSVLKRFYNGQDLIKKDAQRHLDQKLSEDRKKNDPTSSEGGAEDSQDGDVDAPRRAHHGQ